MIHRNLRCLLVALALLALGAGTASANWMGGFVLERGDTAHLGNGQLARITFQFKVTNANGARFIVHAFENGSQLPGSTWGGSSNYPAGTSGTHSNFLTFGSGTVHMDQYRVRMFDPVTSATLLEIYLPVDYTFGSNAVNDIQLSYSSPSWILNGQNLVINFSSWTSEPAGVRVSARPFTGGSLTPGYAASGVSALPMGDGTGQQWFRFSSSTHDVDAIRFQVWNATMSTLLLEFFVPVDLHWGDASISNLTFDPPFPECLAWNQSVTVGFDYATSDPAGCYAWAYGTSPDPDMRWDQTYSGSPLLPVSGHVTRSFRLIAGEYDVTGVRLLMDNHDLSARLLDVTVPVDYHYAPNAIRNVVFTPASPAVLDNGEFVDITYDYVVAQAGGARLQPLPYAWEAVASGYGVNPSGLYPVGSGSTTGFFTIWSGSTLVSRVGLHMYDSAWGGPLHTCFKDVAFTFNGIGGVTAVPAPPVGRGVAMGQNYPNPFNPSTSLPLDLDAPTHVTVKVYDLAGRLVGTIADAVLPAGRTVLSFDGTNLGSGAYLCVAETPMGSASRRLMLLK